MSLIKLAAPRWLKELRGNEKLRNILSVKQVDFADKYSPDFKNITRAAFKDTFSSKAKDDLKTSLADRAKRTLSVNGETIRILPGFGVDAEYTKQKLRPWLVGKKKNANGVGVGISPFRFMKSDKKDIMLTHISPTENLENVKNYFSPSAARTKQSPLTVYSMPTSSDSKIGHISYQERTGISGMTSYHSKVPLNKVVFRGNGTIRASGPEVTTDFNTFKSGIIAKRKYD